MTPAGLLDLFDRVYVINLPERCDRRREVEAELRRSILGSPPGADDGRVIFFEASWPAEAAPFRSTGLKGNFISHLSILRAAHAGELESVLILEDDAQFERHLPAALPVLETHLSGTDWGVVQLGYTASSGAVPAVATPTLVPFRGEVRGLHCYAVHRRALAPLIGHLERQLCGPPGDDIYGPMAVDGSLNTFAWVHTDIPRHLLVPSVCRQRSSRSSIEPRLLDRLVVTGRLLGLARRARHKAAG